MLPFVTLQALWEQQSQLMMQREKEGVKALPAAPPPTSGADKDRAVSSGAQGPPESVTNMGDLLQRIPFRLLGQAAFR